jgi:hypothetical protein
MAGSTLMSGEGHIPEMASNRARRPTARLVASTEVCHRDRLIRSTSLRKGRDHCAHLVKRCVANDRLVRKRWQSRPIAAQIISTPEKRWLGLRRVASRNRRGHGQIAAAYQETGLSPDIAGAFSTSPLGPKIEP